QRARPRRPAPQRRLRRPVPAAAAGQLSPDSRRPRLQPRSARAGARTPRAADGAAHPAGAGVLMSTRSELKAGGWMMLWVPVALCIFSYGVASAQQLLDRILARVGGVAITLTDLQAARALGLVEGATEEAALQQLINRRLLLIEVARFPPPAPSEAAV